MTAGVTMGAPNGDPESGGDGATFTALVLAGSRGPEDPVARNAGLSHKCLVPVAGIPMLVRVVSALARSKSVGHIAIAIEAPELVEALPDLKALQAEGRLSTLPSAATPSLSAAAGLDALESPFPLLITTADHALLDPTMVDRFCADALNTNADVTAGLASSEVIEAAYPTTRRTYLSFQDGRYSGCNLFALLTPESRRAVAFWRRVEQDRKKPWRIARALGPLTLTRYLLRRLTLAGALAALSRAAGVHAAVVTLPIAEAAIDVDKPEDLVLVEQILTSRS